METNCKRKRTKEESVANCALKKDKTVESEILINDPSSKHRKKLSRNNKKSRNSLINECINGSVLADKYIPEELLVVILCYVDVKSLLNCQLVCQYWKTFIQSRVWHKKAEQTTRKTLNFDKRISWTAYYCMSNRMPFDKNLIKNDSGQDGLDFHWELLPIKSVKWSIENPMVPLLLDDLQLEGKACFVTSSSMTWKYQIVDLIGEGFSNYLLDYLQPTIHVSEWYCCSNSPAKYICDIELLNDKGEKKMILGKLENYDESSWDMYNHHTFSRIIRCGEQNQWFKYEHAFKNYGKGLRKIKFIHGGRKINYYGEDTENDSGAKMTRACIKIDLPSLDFEHIKSLSSHHKNVITI